MATACAERGSSLSIYLRDIGAHPVEDRDDPRRALVTSNLGFVVKIAGEYRNLGLPLVDLIGEGNVGLIEGARRFDPARGIRFITFAVWWVRKSIRRALWQNATLVRVPARQLQRLRDLRDTERRLARALGREADREAIAKELRLPIARVDRLLQLKAPEVSLDEPCGRERDTPISDSIADSRARDPEQSLVQSESLRLVRRGLGRLRDCERAVLVDRFGLDGDRALTLTEIGEKLGVSRERVRQIELLARKRLRRVLARPAVRRNATRLSARSEASLRHFPTASSEIRSSACARKTPRAMTSA